MNYFVVVNARNEEKLLGETLEAIMGQSVKPLMVLGVDDNSTDSTVEIFESFGVPVLYLDNERIKERGHNQSLAFNAGVKEIERLAPRWEFILKVDADCKISKNYARDLLAFMRLMPLVGMVGGTPEGQRIRLERVTDGARLIRRVCWDSINGYTVMTAFDSHAILKARQAGWLTVTLSDVKYIEKRSSKKYTLQRWWDTGVLRKSWGHSLTHTVLASLKNMFTGRPLIINGLVMIFAYLVSNPEPDPELDQKWVSEYSSKEIKEYLGRLINR